MIVPEWYSHVVFEDRLELTRRFCKFYDAQFDFLSIENGWRTIEEPALAQAYAIIVSNQIEGNGLPLFSDYNEFDDEYLFGCAGLKLISTTVGFGRSGIPILHEIGHAYAMHLDKEGFILSNDKITGFEEFGSSFHYGHSTAACSGPMATGLCLRELDEDRLLVEFLGRNRLLDPFGPLTMYAADLIAADDVPDNYFVTNPERTVTGGDILLKTDPDIELITVERIIAEHGEVVSPEQTETDIGCMVFSTKPLSAAAMAFETRKCQKLETDDPSHEPSTIGGLEWATHGKVQANSRLPNR